MEQNEQIRFEIIQDCLTQSFNGFINRAIVVLAGTNNTSEIESYLSFIEKELVSQCVNKNFIALNINVIRSNEARVIENENLRAFYFEMHKLFCLRMHFDYNVTDFHGEIFERLYRVYRETPIKMFDGNIANLSENNLALKGDDYKNLVSRVAIVKDTNEFLGLNPWYSVYVLVNIFSQNLLECLFAIRNNKNVK